MILILFTGVAPNLLTDELSAQGHQVYEALAVSEVLALAEQFLHAQIIVTGDVDAERAKVIQRQYPTMHLKADATFQDVCWELDTQRAIIQ